MWWRRYEEREGDGEGGGEGGGRRLGRGGVLSSPSGQACTERCKRRDECAVAECRAVLLASAFSAGVESAACAVGRLSVARRRSENTIAAPHALARSSESVSIVNGDDLR